MKSQQDKGCLRPFVHHDGLAAGQFKPVPEFTLPFNLRHGPALPASAEEVSRLEAACT